MISLSAFLKITSLDGSNETQLKEFIQAQTIFTMELSSQESNLNWLEGGQEFLHKIEQERNSEDKVFARTVCLNETKGNAIFRIESDYRVLLFLICRETEVLGQYLDSDFAVLFFKILIDSENKSTEDSSMDEGLTNPRSSVQELTPKADSELLSKVHAL